MGVSYHITSIVTTPFQHTFTSNLKIKLLSKKNLTQRRKGTGKREKRKEKRVVGTLSVPFSLSYFLFIFVPPFPPCPSVMKLKIAAYGFTLLDSFLVFCYSIVAFVKHCCFQGGLEPIL
jgi:hypothetical protein